MSHLVGNQNVGFLMTGLINSPTPTYFAVNTLNLYLKRFYYGIMPSKDADAIANSEDPDQTAPPKAV